MSNYNLFLLLTSVRMFCHLIVILTQIFFMGVVTVTLLSVYYPWVLNMSFHIIVILAQIIFVTVTLLPVYWLNFGWVG